MLSKLPNTDQIGGPFLRLPMVLVQPGLSFYQFDFCPISVEVTQSRAVVVQKIIGFSLKSEVLLVEARAIELNFLLFFRVLRRGWSGFVWQMFQPVLLVVAAWLDSASFWLCREVSGSHELQKWLKSVF